ncbi:hypothetical protein ACFLTP_09155 [Chloroflexota bacterium]
MKPYISYFQLGFWLLITFMELIIVGIIFINQHVKPITLNLGITFVTFGIIELVALFIVKYFGTQQIAQVSGIPAAIQSWLPQFFNHFMASMMTIGIGFAVVGLALIIISIVYEPREAAE